jgi:hypothetical protein
MGIRPMGSIAGIVLILFPERPDGNHRLVRVPRETDGADT